MFKAFIQGTKIVFLIIILFISLFWLIGGPIIGVYLFAHKAILLGIICIISGCICGGIINVILKFFNIEL